MEGMRDRRHLVLIPAGALLAILPLIFKGFSCGHDFGFHLISWLEAGSQWKQGVLFPHWEFTAAWNAGEPRFVFYPPISWVIGALIGLVLPWAAAPNTFLWLALTACGFTMHRLALEWTNESNALIAACFYMVHPYMLFTFFERSAFGELLAAAWIPLILLALLRPRVTIPGIAIPVALLWLTNDPAAVMGCYLLALLAVVRVVGVYSDGKNTRLVMKEALRILGGTCLGLALAGFYLVPAIVEQRWIRVRMAEVKGTRIQDNFFFEQWGTPSHQAILFIASYCGLALLILIAVFGAIVIYHGVGKTESTALNYRRFVFTALLLAAVVSGFLLTAPSAFLWRHIPEMHYLQFPWRFDALLGAIAAVLLALALVRIRMRPTVAILIALAVPLLFGLEGNLLFRQMCNGGRDVRDLVASFYRSDVYYSDEYTPAGSDPLAIGHNNPDAWIAETPDSPAPNDLPRENSVVLSNRLHFHVSSTGPAYFVVNVRDYPAWRIDINGIPSTIRPHRNDGLIVVPVQEGLSKIDIGYALTADQILGWIMTAVAGVALFLCWRWNRLRSADRLAQC